MLSFVVDVAEMGFSREAHKMLTGTVVPHLTHILKPVPKDHASMEWMQATDDAHLSTWLTCVRAEQLDVSLPTTERAHLAASLDLPLQFGGVRVQSLMLPMKRYSDHGQKS